jgi:hypothetical protein
MSITRRGTVFGVTAVTALVLSRRGHAAESVEIKVTKGPDCSCCDGWAKHLRSSGFAVSVVESTEMNRLKAKLGVPRDLQTCHTAEVGKYVLEGHVPAAAIRSLLNEKPQAIGLAVAGMPVGSPGMEVEGSSPQEYSVILFRANRRETYMRFKGLEEIANCG